MGHFGYSIMQVFSIAGSTFLIGITIGWVLALANIGISTSDRNRSDGEDRGL